MFAPTVIRQSSVDELSLPYLRRSSAYLTHTHSQRPGFHILQGTASFLFHRIEQKLLRFVTEVLQVTSASVPRVSSPQVAIDLSTRINTRNRRLAISLALPRGQYVLSLKGSSHPSVPQNSTRLVFSHSIATWASTSTAPR